MRISNILNLARKELWSLIRDPIMLVLIFFAFSVSVFLGTKAIPETLNKASIAIIDGDQSPLSNRIREAFYPPYFTSPSLIDRSEMESRMDAGLDTFALDIPPDFQRDVLAGHATNIQLNVDATRISQAFTGSGYVQSIVNQEIQSFIVGANAEAPPTVNLAIRARFNPELNKSWFGGIMQIINQITMLSIVLTGTALIRERERGTIEHILVMPVTPFEIMVSKILAMASVVVLASTFSLIFIVHGLLSIPLQGSLILFFLGTVVYLFATTSMGIVMGTVARSMPQFGLLLMLVLPPLQMLSGGSTPRESMPSWVQTMMLATPTTHFVMLAQAILYRGAGLAIVWPQLVSLMVIGSVCFAYALRRFRQTIGSMA